MVIFVSFRVLVVVCIREKICKILRTTQRLTSPNLTQGRRYSAPEIVRKHVALMQRSVIKVFSNTPRFLIKLRCIKATPISLKRVNTYTIYFFISLSCLLASTTIGNSSFSLHSIIAFIPLYNYCNRTSK